MTRQSKKNTRNDHIHVMVDNLDEQITNLGFDEIHKSHNYIYKLKTAIQINTVVLNSQDQITLLLLRLWKLY